MSERWDENNWKRRFAVIWTGQAFSLFGSTLVGFALIWWLTQTTGSATVLATASLAGMLPQVLLGPVAGALVDRWNRRAVMMLADSCIAVLTAGLAYLFLIGAAQVWHVYGVMFMRSALSAFQWPAMQASTSLMVPDRHLSRVAGFNQSLQGAMGIVAPPLGALLLGVLPMPGVLAIDVVTALLGIVPLFFIAIPQPARMLTATGHEQTGAPRPSVLQDMAAGLRYLWVWPGLLTLLLMATLLNFLFSPAFSLLPILVTRHFGGQALQLGWMNSAQGLGVVAGGLALGVWGGFKRRVVTSMLGLVGMGAGTLMMGMAPASAFGLALGGMLVVGVMNPITNGPLQAILQSTVAPEMQGRVMSLVNSIAAAMTPLGLLVAGPLSDAFGVQLWYWVAGGAAVLMAIIALLSPAIVNLEQASKSAPVVVGAVASR
jgi:DHA3 family macrolide efflux protein-like MFS transporter